MLPQEYVQLASNVNILDVLRFIENDLKVNFNIREQSTINLTCPYFILNKENSGHKTDAVEKTSINTAKNYIKCWTPQCEANKPMDTIQLIREFYELNFPDAVKKILDIEGIPYEDTETNISPEARINALRTRYVNEKHNNLMRGYELLEEEASKKLTIDEENYKSAAKFMLKRGISKEVARKFKLGIGGGKSTILTDTGNDLLKDAKILSRNSWEIMSKRIIIPNISKGMCVGMTGRTIDANEEKRYLNVGEVKNLINIDKAKKYDTIYMFEGGLNAASYCEITGKDNCIAMQGATSFKVDFLKEIVKNQAKFNEYTEFVFITDNDEAGLEATINVGMEILKLGFTFTVVLSDVDEKGKKIDLNDILIKHGKVNALNEWNKLMEKQKPYIIFAIEETMKKIEGTNPLVIELRRCKVIEKFTKIFDPNERYKIQEYFHNMGYPTIKGYLDYMNIKYTEKPKVGKNDKIVCYIDNISKELEENLNELNYGYNVIKVGYNIDFFEIDKEKNEVILVCDTLHIFKAKKLAQQLMKDNIRVRIYHSEKEMKSAMEYHVALAKATDLDTLIRSIC